MSSLTSATQLRPASCQLPMSWYVDPEIFEREKKLLFDAGSNYVGHELMVPEVGDYLTLAWMHHAKLLVRNSERTGVDHAGGIELLSNICRDRQSLLLEGRGNARRDLADFGCSEDFDFSGYVLDRVESTDYATNWKTFVEVYLEVYHVDFLHAGLGNFADCGNFHVRHGALWATYFPGLTLEWYPNVLIVSNLIPRSPGLTTNVVEFYYREEIVHFEREFIEAQQAAYAETALEDDEICRRLDRGRRALWEQGLDDAGPYQSPMEDTMVHFHEWLRRALEGK